MASGDSDIATDMELRHCLEVISFVLWIIFVVLIFFCQAHGNLIGDYKGLFRFNHRHGYGELTYPDGAIFKGEWKYDEKVGGGVHIHYKLLMHIYCLIERSWYWNWNHRCYFPRYLEEWSQVEFKSSLSLDLYPCLPPYFVVYRVGAGRYVWPDNTSSFHFYSEEGVLRETKPVPVNAAPFTVDKLINTLKEQCHFDIVAKNIVGGNFHYF